MKNNQDLLSSIQITILISSSIIGVLVLTLPRIATETVRVDGVFATFASGIIALFFAVVIAILSRRYPNETVMEYPKHIIGKIPAKIFGLFLVLYTVLVSGIILRTFSDALKAIILERTPLEVIMLTMLFTTIYLILNGISSIAKICEGFLPLVVFALVLLLVLSFRDFDIEELRPMFARGFLPAFKALPNITLAYLGFEILYFIVPFTNKPQKLIPYTVLGILIPIVIYTALVGITVGVFGEEPTKMLMYPTLNLARQIAFPGAFAERFDIFFAIIWILAAFTTLSIFYYMASFSLTHLFCLRNYRPFILILLPIIYLVGILPQNIFQIETFSSYISYAGGIFVFLSLPMLLVSIAKRKGGKQSG